MRKRVITRSRLREIIQEELLEVRKEQKLSDRQKRERVMPGWEELAGLASGIAEAKPQCGPGNPYHAGGDSNCPGCFTNPGKEAGSWSIRRDGPHSADCRSGQARRPSANKKTVWTKIKCGRGEGGKSKAPHRCFDGSKITDIDESAEAIGQQPIHFDSPQALKLWLGQQVEEVIGAASRDLDEREQLLGEDDAERIKFNCSRMGLKSLSDWLAIQNNMVASAKGDLFKSAKNKK